jgi:hypothetical protein
VTVGFPAVPDSIRVVGHPEPLIAESDTGAGAVETALAALATLPGGVVSPAILLWRVPAGAVVPDSGAPASAAAVPGTYAVVVSAVTGAGPLRDLVDRCSCAAAVQAAADGLADSAVALTICRLAVSA